MNADDDPIGETDLLAFVDDHLDPLRRRAVEEHLARDAAAAARVAADAAINAGLRQLFQRYHEEQPPERLRRLLRATAPSRKPLRRTLTKVAAGLALLAGGGAGGWWVSQNQAEPPRPALTGVERFAAGPLQPAALTSGPPPNGAAAPVMGEPVQWLGESLRGAVHVPDLSAAGLQLVAQGLVGNRDFPSLQLTYQDSQGRSIYLFLQARWDDIEPRMRVGEDGERGVVYWANGPMVFAMAGEAPPEELRVLADAVQQAAPVAAPAPAPIGRQRVIAR